VGVWRGRVGGAESSNKIIANFYVDSIADFY
jgi:hypothetical protein